MKMDLGGGGEREDGWEGIDGISLAQDRDQ
jgi:hypothetical protein